MKTIQLGVFGFGVVGQGLYQVLRQTKGIKASIKKIAVKHRDKPRSIPQSYFTYDGNTIFQDPEIDVVVELIDDADAAFEILKRALAHGKHVVTANKKMLAEHLEEIVSLQQRYNRSVLYEGAVCGSIPIIRNLEEYYDNDLVESVEGIFNGSTNYILTNVIDEQKNYADALHEAQVAGFAESDPTLDVKGFDPKFKLAIVIAHAFGVFVKPEHIINIGIDALQEHDLKFARDRGYTIKLVARAFRQGDQLIGFVAPQFIDATHPLFTVKREYNAVLVEGAFAEKQLFIGKGAGSFPTASAVLSDISALTYDYKYEYKKQAQTGNYLFTNKIGVEVFVRFKHGEKISVQDFIEFKNGYAAHGQHCMTGIASLEKIKAWSLLNEVSVIIAPEATVIEIEKQPALVTDSL